MIGPTRGVLVLLVAVWALATLGCGVPTDQTAAPIDPDELPESLRPVVVSESSTTTTMPTDDASTVPVWLVRPTQQEGERLVLESVRRPVVDPNLRTALQQLFEPVPASEAPLVSQWALAEIGLIDVTVDPTTATATITLTDSPPFIGDVFTQAIAQLVFTASEFTDVDVVQFQFGDGPLVDVPYDGGFRQQVTTADYASLDPAVVPATPPPESTTTTSS